MIEAKVIEDSFHTYSPGPEGVPKVSRITTLQLKYPRYIHAEFLTHRMFSRNASSSRAIPVGRLAQASLADMVEPILWQKNQPGMQAKPEELEEVDREQAQLIWRNMAVVCAKGAEDLAKLGLHKQWANRPLEWFGHISVVVTATEWDNFFALRAHELAQPEIHALAVAMQTALEESNPQELMPGEWHLPYVHDEYRLLPLDTQLKISAARCARVSYMKHDGSTASIEDDIELYHRLVGNMPIHASPCEHQATPMDFFNESDRKLGGNFKNWVQYRKVLERNFGETFS